MRQLFTTIWNHRAYNALLETPQRLPSTGESIRVELKSLSPWTKGSLKGFSRYTFLAKVSSLGYEASGSGASNLPGEAVQKAISEAYERLIFSALRGVHGFNTSNGFAAHPNYKVAVQNACTEALERDAVLVHWLTRTPFLNLPVQTESAQAQLIRNSLAGTPFFAKHLLISTRGWISTLTIVAEEHWGGGAIVAHGTGKNINHALSRTLVELERQASVARDLLPRTQGFQQPVDRIFDHCTFSKQRLARASWMAGSDTSWQAAAKSWRPFTRAHIADLQIQHLAEGSIQVVRASGRMLQDLFFGKTAAHLVNPARLETEDINLEAHFVA